LFSQQSADFFLSVRLSAPELAFFFERLPSTPENEQ
jgi:hypothetical protein